MRRTWMITAIAGVLGAAVLTGCGPKGSHATGGTANLNERNAIGAEGSQPGIISTAPGAGGTGAGLGAPASVSKSGPGTGTGSTGNASQNTSRAPD